jgi:2-oxoisovalerate dehydrogenase E1 component
MSEEKRKNQDTQLSFDEFKKEVLADYRLAVESREASLIGRKEVLTGKAKFGIFGDGKEVAQLALAKSFRKGDFRAGYYRDQTIAFATGMFDLQQYFAQLYADPNSDHDPASGGRMMNSHFSTPLIDKDGNWIDQTGQKNSAADLSPVASQMLKLPGLGYASKLYRERDDLKNMEKFSRNGDEVAFGTIGDASTAEGMFYESVNAIGIMGGPVVISIWDDNYGISVPIDYQVTKQNLSEVLKGFEYDEKTKQG